MTKIISGLLEACKQALIHSEIPTDSLPDHVIKQLEQAIANREVMMAKQEEIREEVAKEFYNTRALAGDMPWSQAAAVRTVMADLAYAKAGQFLSYLHSQGVVIKVDRKLPKNPYDPLNKNHFNGYEMALWRVRKLDYVAVEPLVKD